jgi:hypothetical protein
MFLRTLTGKWGPVYGSASRGDAVYSPSDYVQISDFVTKVLIRKRFRQLAGS